MKNSKDALSHLTSGILTESMDIGTKEYEDFKLLIRSKVSETPKNEKIKTSLLGLKYHMEDYLDSKSETIEVGNFIKQFIKSIEIKQVDFARYLEIRPSNLSKILNGERRLTVELALILEKLSSINAGLWLRIQNRNEINRLQKTHSKQLKKYQLKELIG
ncbi:MAG: HigA family addiction module antitoxin [Bacteroidota bacterium]